MSSHPLTDFTDVEELERLLKGINDVPEIDKKAFADYLKSQVIGQDHVCNEVAEEISRRLYMKKPGRPIGVFLFAGPPGTGKTYLAKKMAKFLERKLLHLDMSQFMDAHASTQLFGSPKGYVGSDSYGKLTGGLRDIPTALVLLDEIEKASPDVLKKFLTAWNDGFITEASDGKEVSTLKAIFALTSNAATDKLTDISTQYAEEPDNLRRAATNALKEAKFAPEVLDRLDRIFIFKILKDTDTLTVAGLEIQKLIEENYGLKLATKGIPPAFLIKIYQRVNAPDQPASNREMTRFIEEMLGDCLVEIRKKGVKKIRITYHDSIVGAEEAE